MKIKINDTYHVASCCSPQYVGVVLAWYEADAKVGLPSTQNKHDFFSRKSSQVLRSLVASKFALLAGDASVDSGFREIHVPRAWRVYLVTGLDFREKKSCLFWVDRSPTLASASYLDTLL